MSNHTEADLCRKFERRMPVNFNNIWSDELSDWKQITESVATLGQEAYGWGSSKLVSERRQRQYKRSSRGAAKASTANYEADMNKIFSNPSDSDRSKVDRLRAIHSVVVD